MFNFFDHLNDLKLKTSKLESYRSRRGLQFSYKNHLDPRSYEKDTIFLNCTLPRQSGWRGATVLPRVKDLHVEIVVRRGRSCNADACGVAACFGCATDLDVAKRVIFENKKATVLDLEFVLKKH